MGLKSYRPLTPTLRYKQIGDRKEITADKPYKPLTEGIKRSSGRNNAGEITSRRRGGGHKKLYRIIEWSQETVSYHRFQASVRWHPLHCRNDRIRSEPFRSYRSGQVPERQALLHHRPG